MAYLECPKCAARLRVPESSKPLALRCPSCKFVFQASPTQGSPAGAETKIDDGDAVLDAAASDSSASKLLSAADEALLRELGSG